MPNQPPPERALIDGARRYAEATAGQTLLRIELILGDGGRRSIECPLCARPAESVGWQFGVTGATHCGRPVAVTGKLLDLLKLLAGATEAMTLDEIKLAVWDRETADRTVRNTISKLRLTLAAQLQLGHDPIDAHDEAYTLLIG